LLHQWEYANILFNAGLCYAISQGSLRLVTPLISFIASKSATKTGLPILFEKLPQDKDDPIFSVYLRSVGILPANSLSREHKQRWLVFRDTDHFKLKYREGNYYWKNKPRDVPMLKNCCVRDLVAMHNYKDLEDVKMMLDLSKKYNGTGNIIIPQEPTLFEYQIPKSFRVDKYLNALRAPKEQCLWQGVGFNFTCRNREEYDKVYQQLENIMNEYLSGRNKLK